MRGDAPYVDEEAGKRAENRPPAASGLCYESPLLVVALFVVSAVAWLLLVSCHRRGTPNDNVHALCGH